MREFTVSVAYQPDVQWVDVKVEAETFHQAHHLGYARVLENGYPVVHPDAVRIEEIK